MVYQNTYIKDIRDQLLGCKQYCREVLSPLHFDHLNWKRSEKEWTIAQVLDHLNIVNGSYIDRSNQVLEKLNLNEDQGNGKFNSAYQGNMIINLISAENQIKTKTIPNFYPQADIYEISIKAEYCSSLDQFRKFIDKIEHFDLNKGKVQFVDDQHIKFNLGDVLKIVMVHMGRHFKQIDRLITDPAFPA